MSNLADYSMPAWWATVPAKTRARLAKSPKAAAAHYSAYCRRIGNKARKAKGLPPLKKDRFK